jgi:hypothetical protein
MAIAADTASMQTMIRLGMMVSWGGAANPIDRLCGGTPLPTRFA